MRFKAALPVAVLAGFVCASSVAQQTTDTATENSPQPGEPGVQAESTADAAAAEAVAKSVAASKADSDEKNARAIAETLLAAQAAGYKLVDKDGKQVFCKREPVTGSRLATRTRCLTLAQIEQERLGAKDTLDDMTRRSAGSPDQ